MSTMSLTPWLSGKVNLEDGEEEEEEADEDVVIVSKPKKKSGGTFWWKEEDALLISAWLNVSMDATTETGQKAGAYWKRIAQYVSETQDKGDPNIKWPIKRTSKMCKARWNNKINPGVLKLGSCFDASVQHNQSRWSEDDHLRAAHVAYRALNNNQACSVEHCWRLLRNEKKWKIHVKKWMNEDGHSSKKTKNTICGGYTSVSSHEETPIEVVTVLSTSNRHIGSSTSTISVEEAHEHMDNLRETRIEKKSIEVETVLPTSNCDLGRNAAKRKEISKASSSTGPISAEEAQEDMVSLRETRIEKKSIEVETVLPTSNCDLGRYAAKRKEISKSGSSTGTISAEEAHEDMDNLRETRIEKKSMEVETVLPTSNSDLGRNVAKRKEISKAGSSTGPISVEEVHEDMHSLRETMVEKNAYLKKLIELKEKDMIMKESQYERDAAMKRREQEWKEREYKRLIMTEDLSNKSDAQREWFASERLAIAAKRRNR